MNEVEQRAAVVAESRRWLGTPYHHRARVMGAGIDCLFLLVESFRGAGLIEDFDPGMYSKQWFLHRSEEKYLEGLLGHTVAVDLGNDTPLSQRDVEPLLSPGDILMFRHGRTFSHSALVTQWPYIIHASAPSDIVEEVSLRTHPLSLRPIKAFSYWGPR